MIIPCCNSLYTCNALASLIFIFGFFFFFVCEGLLVFAAMLWCARMSVLCAVSRKGKNLLTGYQNGVSSR